MTEEEKKPKKPKVPRQKMPEQDPIERAHNFYEVALGYTYEMAMEETGRCIQCKKRNCQTGCPVNIDIPDFIAALVTATGQDKPAFDSSVVGRFAFDGGVEVSEERLAVTDFKMTMGEETATGSLALSAKPVLLLAGAWLNLRFRERFAAPGRSEAA